MIKQTVLNNKFVEIKPGDTETIKMNKYTDYSIQAYTHTITIHHNNAAALASEVNVFDFARNALSKLTLQIGAGNELYDLDLNAHLVRQLELRKQLIYKIDKTQGDDKVSTITLIVDFLSLGFVAPKDTILFNTGGYDHLMTQVVAASGNKIENCTVTKTRVGITESFKTDVSLNRYIDGNGNSRSMPAQNKKPIHRRPSFNSSNPNWEIEIPNNIEIAKIILYVTDDGKISKDHIKNVTVKKSNEKRISVAADVLENWNRENLKSFSNKLYDGILVLDIAQGQYTETLKTIGMFIDSKLEIDIEKGAASEPILNIIYETIEQA